MGIFDRYLLRFFVRTLIIFFVSFAGLYVLIDTVNNFEEFVAYGEKSGGFLSVLADYYSPRVLTLFDRTSAILALTSALFVLSWMQSTNELVAVMAAGVSRKRIIRPLLLAVLIVSGLAVVNRELAIPRYRHQLSRNAQDWMAENGQPVVPRFDNETNIYFSGREAQRKERKILDPALRLPGTLSAFGRQITAASAEYRPPDGDVPGGYLLDGVRSPAELDQIPSGYIQDRCVVYTAADTSWLQPGQCFIVSRVDFEQLTSGDGWRRFSSSRQLIRALQNPSLDFGADVRVAVHARFVQPILDLMLFMIALPLVFTSRSRNVFVSVGLCLIIVTAYLLFVPICHFLGNNYLISPALAAWCPVIVLSPVAFFMSAAIWQ
jgi:lipopolysaccharide export system permease protein